MRENIYNSHIGQKANNQDTWRINKIQQQNRIKTVYKNGERNWIDIFSKKTKNRQKAQETVVIINDYSEMQVKMTITFNYCVPLL